MDKIALIVNHGEDIILALTSLVTFFSVVANKTKTDKDNKALGVFSKVVNFLALNFDKLPKKPTKFNQ